MAFIRLTLIATGVASNGWQLLVTGAGPTVSRPAIPGAIDPGGMYFDTDLGLPIWSNGVAYVDAAGVLV